MKAIKILLAVIVITIASTSVATAQDSNPKYQHRDNTTIEKIKVGGLCEMDKYRIESTALQIDGVKSADWNESTQILTVTYNVFVKDAVDKVEKKLASIGHDTPKYKATDVAYNSLPLCCHYRKE